MNNFTRKFDEKFSPWVYQPALTSRYETIAKQGSRFFFCLTGAKIIL